MQAPARSPGIGHRRRRRVWLAWALLIVAMALVVARVVMVAHRPDATAPHGHPDPDGVRVSYIRGAAAALVPSSASVTRTTLISFRWDRATCDGDAPGWADAHAVVDFTGVSLAQLDAHTASWGWHRPGGLTTDGTDSDAATVLIDQEAREYAPTPDRYAALASVYRIARGWELDISVSPAEVPAHDC